MTIETTRRQFLIASGGATAGLIIGVSLPASDAAASTAPATMNPFVIIGTDSTVTVLSKHLDKGQGAATGLATLVAEDLDASWDQMRADFAPSNAKLYNNLHWGPYQGTGGSSAIANSWEQYRKAGATAKAMLVACS